MKYTKLSKSKLRELKLRKKKRAIIASRNVSDCVNNMPKDKPTFAIKVLKKVIFGKNDVHYVQEAKSWKQEKSEQPKRLHHSYKKWKWVAEFSKEKGWHTVHKLIKRKSEYFHKDPVKMTRQAYWEKLVQHKLAKWERKNPQPCSDDDMFTEKLVEWKDKREKAVERFRDVVISAYDKLPLIGRFKVSDGKFKEEKIADIKDINGEGHNVNNLHYDSSKLLQKVQKVTDIVHAKRGDLVATNLKDHKRQKGRIICPTTLMMKKAA